MGNRLLVQTNRINIDRFAWIALAIGLVVQIAIILIAFRTADPAASDGNYYILIAREPSRLSPASDAPVFSIGPVYPIFLIPFYQMISSNAPVAQAVAVRIVQAILNSVTSLSVYLIATHLFGKRTGRVALLAQAFDARHLFVTGTIATETLFISLFVVFMVVYLFAISAERLREFAGAGLLLGIATLTRPLPIAFPGVLAVYGFFRQSNRKRSLQGVGILFAAMLLAISPWWLRNTQLNAIVPVSDSVFSHFWLGSRPDARDLGGASWSQAALDDAAEVKGDRPDTLGQLTPQDYAAAGFRNILAAPDAWIGRIVSDLLKAYIQPYGTSLLIDTDESAKSLVQGVLSGERSLRDLMAIPGLIRRTLMYLWHFWGLIGGVVGAVLCVCQRLWKTLPMIGWVLYCSAGLSLLLVEPRYLFPLMFAFTIFAAYATVQGWEAIRSRTNKNSVSLTSGVEQQV